MAARGKGDPLHVGVENVVAIEPSDQIGACIKYRSHMKSPQKA
jgi:hypothetical protein